MNVVIVFESIHGNTRPIAEAIGSGFEEQDEVRVEPVAAVDPAPLRADLLVVGGGTHLHGLATPTTRRAAVQDPTLVLDPTALGAPLQEWLNALPHAPGRATAFDTRLDAPVLQVMSHASATIAGHLTRRGYDLVADPQSFLIDHESTLIDGELERARRWGAALSADLHAADRDTMTAMAKVSADN
jgi:menaquinone-dependent protoporphyrinogen IX oxidase